LRADQRRLRGRDDVLLGVEIIAKGIVVCNPNVHARSDVHPGVAIEADAVVIDQDHTLRIYVHHLHLSKTASKFHGKDAV